MNILMLGWELPPHNSGGLGVACYHMSKALALEGAQIDFVLPYDADHSEITHMQVHAATNRKVTDHTIGLSTGTGAYDSLFFDGDESIIRQIQTQYVDYVAEMVKDKKPDAIHAHDWLTVEAGIKAKEVCDAPLIVHVHATEFDRSGEFSGNPMVHEIEYQGLIMADRIIAVSEATKKVIVDRYGIPADKIEVVYNAIDVSHLTDEPYDQRTYRYLEHLKDEGYTVVATMTRFTVQKGLRYLLEAAALASSRYDKLVFLLAGDGEQRDELLQLSADLGIADKVFFTGFIRGKQWREAYQVADIFVMSSVSEPFGLTALEAAHYDNALVISRQSGVGEILNSIYRYDFWDTQRLADQMVGIALSPALESELKVNIKYEYNRLSWQQVAQQCLNLYQRTTRGVKA